MAQLASGEDGDAGMKLADVRRVYVDQLTGGEVAAQMRDLLMSSLHNSKLFVVTENAERADAILKGAAEDLIYTEQFSSSDGVNLRAATGASRSTSSQGLGNRGVSVSVGDNESVNLHERKHEALATVRLVNREGDVIWSTTQESGGTKFRGANADVAEKVTRQLGEDFGRVSSDGAPARPTDPAHAGGAAGTR